MKKFDHFASNLDVLARAVIKAAYTVYDLIEEPVWLSMLKARNDMTHIYDGEEAKRMVQVILKEYIPAFLCMREGVLAYYGDGMGRSEI